MSRVLIVGAGLTCSLCACLLRREMPNKVIVVWDKSRGAGKFVTYACPYHNPTATMGHFVHNFDIKLLAHGVLKPLLSSVEGEVMDGGSLYLTSSLDFSSPSLFLSFSSSVRPSLSLERWEVCRKGTATEQFDAVVLTVAIPQILQLQGDVGSCEY
uniref:Amine oxidase domain-containing protein n=1 Tax=Oncorhynchus mykiss TaxID=8022 RepID=A0A8C7Q8F0_ONCMY